MRDEYDFQKDVIAYLKKNKIWHYRTQMGSNSGLPDIIACYRGMFVGIELKREDGKGKPTEQQLKVQDDIEDAGGTGLIISSIEELHKALDKLDDIVFLDMGTPTWS